ncbi:DNA-methyltransferase [Qipengyuania sp. DSG2-2]|uniref:DNA-methyltransferase n=1 Tax=Qipengyuania sp. DGS2-2 TaxID=3349631 RepID=UPI0036D26438
MISDFDFNKVSDSRAEYLGPDGEKNHTAVALTDKAKNVHLLKGECLDVMSKIAEKYPNGCFDMIFADPPYNLSNGGFTCRSGKMASVNKGQWDKSKGIELDYQFTLDWLELCQRLLKVNGTIWVSGTHHVIFLVGHAMQTHGFKILNQITWEKPNPPPNLSCRFFTHSTETLIWAAKSKKSKHVFNYEDMKAEAGGKQMKSVWQFTAPTKSEKTFGKHPTQKPLQLLERCIRASTNEGDFVLDPFAGSSTTGVSAVTRGRGYCGIEADEHFIQISKQRLVSAIQKEAN